MIIEILICILGFFVLLILEHLLVPLGFFSIWTLLMIYLYQKIEKNIFWVFLTITGVALGVTIGLGVGTYLLSVGLSLLLLFTVKKITPEEYLVIRYIQYFLSFFVFYILRLVLGELSINGDFPDIRLNNILNYLILSLLSTIICILVDKFYFQVRLGAKSSGKGTGIEIRRK